MTQMKQKTFNSFEDFGREMGKPENHSYFRTISAENQQQMMTPLVTDTPEITAAKQAAQAAQSKAANAVGSANTSAQIATQAADQAQTYASNNASAASFAAAANTAKGQAVTAKNNVNTFYTQAVTANTTAQAAITLSAVNTAKSQAIQAADSAAAEAVVANTAKIQAITAEQAAAAAVNQPSPYTPPVDNTGGDGTTPDTSGETETQPETAAKSSIFTANNLLLAVVVLGSAYLIFTYSKKKK